MSQITKNQLRIELRKKRTEIFNSDTDDSFPAQFDTHFKDFLTLQSEDVIAGFYPIGSEPEILPLLHRLSEKFKVCLPVVQGQNPMVFRLWRPGDGLKENSFGIPEPLASTREVIPTVILVPCLGFTQTGGRLGYGSGHYDRTLAALKAKGHAFKIIGVSYNALKLDHLPLEAHDVMLDGMLTEVRAWWCR